MSVWLCIPTKRPVDEANENLKVWREMGYKIALFIDSGDEEAAKDKIHDFRGIGKYPGYAQAVNGLIRNVHAYDGTCDWVVTGGDDTLPDTKETAQAIAAQCSAHFEGTFGVMQPTGDRFAGGSIDRICGSPWLGREFCERINKGQGPFWPEYTHMFPDEEMFCVTRDIGILWQRRDLTHLHKHFMRASEDVNAPAIFRAPPPHLVEANSPHHWDRYKFLFEQRKAAGFPGHEPLVKVAA